MSKILYHELKPAMTGFNVDHIEHIEDLPILHGDCGARIARLYLTTCLDTLAGKVSTDTRVSIKYDGSVSIIAGYDPADGLFFVAKKSIFNKVPVYYKSPEEIMATLLRRDLKDKLLAALDYLPEVIEDGIFHGDYLYSTGDVVFNHLRGRTSFQPNTLIYAPRFSELRQKIRGSVLGIAWHTQYEGNIGNLQVTTKYPMPKSSGNVVCIDCTIDIKDELAGGSNTLMDKDSYENWSEYLMSLDAQIKFLADHLCGLSNHREFPALFKMYQNARAKGYMLGMGQWLDDYFTSERNKRKTPRGKRAVDERGNDIAKLIVDNHLNEVMRLINNIKFMKHYLIKELDKHHSDDFITFYRMKDGEVHETGAEGYVVTMANGKMPVKIVNRKQFSFLNFSGEVCHGWER